MDLNLRDEVENEEVFDSHEKINKKLFLVRIKLFLLRIKHFPTLLLYFLKKTFFGLVKLWGIILLCIMVWFLWFTDSFATLYYKVSMNLERYKIENLEEVIARKQIELEFSEKKMSCYQGQFKRIAEDKKVDTNYCKDVNNTQTK